MAPRGAKRSAAAQLGASPMKKPARSGSLQRKFDMIAEVLEDYEGLPKDTRQMLTNVLVTSLGTKQDQRHCFQDKVVAMLEVALRGVEAGINASIETELATVRDADAEKARREALKTQAEATHITKVAEVASKQAEVEETDAAVTAARDAVKEAKKSQKAGDKELEETSKNKEKLQGAIKDWYEPLKGSDMKPAQRKTMVKNLIAFVKKIGFDSSLAEAVQVALHSNPGFRTTFDQICLTQTDIDLNQRIAGFEAAIAEGGPAKEARAQAVVAAQSVLDAAEARHNASTEAYDTASSEEASLKMSVKEALVSLEEHSSEVEAAVLAGDAAKERLVEFQQGPLAAFKELKERSTPPPVVEEPPAAETTATPQANM